MMNKKVLTIAGSDSGGGAGIQADLKTMCAYDVYGMSVITAVTAQNTLGVQKVEELPPEIVEAQLASVLEDVRPDAVKVGMVYSRENVRIIAEAIERWKLENIVLDPVMVSTSGRELLRPEAAEAMWELLFPKVTLVTPNVPEAESLLDVLSRSGSQADALAEPGEKAYVQVRKRSQANTPAELGEKADVQEKKRSHADVLAEAGEKADVQIKKRSHADAPVEPGEQADVQVKKRSHVDASAETGEQADVQIKKRSQADTPAESGEKADVRGQRRRQTEAYGQQPDTWEQMRGQPQSFGRKSWVEETARNFSAHWRTAFLIKGGHLEGAPADYLYDGKAGIWFPGQRIETRHTHGTGCTLSTAIACNLAKGLGLPEAVREAKEYLTGCVRYNPGIGNGNGPMNHLWRMERAAGLCGDRSAETEGIS